MQIIGLRRAAAFACLFALATAPVAATAGSTLKPFADEAEFLALLMELRKKAGYEGMAEVAAPPADLSPAPTDVQSAPPAGTADEDASSLDSIQVTGSRITTQDTTSITNVQTQGVDEGDIVKRQGDFLLVLRRGRIFSVRVGGDRLQAVDAIDAFAPGSDPEGTWYDEMLVSADTVVVIGYSYSRGGTEVGLFDLRKDGRMRHRATYQLRSNDYYSSRNYASRLIGTTLVLYTPLDVLDRHPDDFWPSLRHWRRGEVPPPFQRILPATRIYRTTGEFDPGEDGLTLHTVSLCDLAAPELACRSTAVLGPEGRTFYVSQDSVYVWTTPWTFRTASANVSGVWRIPLDGSAPTGLRTSGSPIDQMSFLERDGVLNVLVGTENRGEGMWRAESAPGEVALLRVALARFGDGSGAARPNEYRQIPGLDAYQHSLQNRYLGDWLLAGTYIYRRGGKQPAPRPLIAVRYAEAGPIEPVHTGHDIERIDTLGAGGAVAIGEHGPDLMFTSVQLDAHAARVGTFVLPNATQGDQRSHGYFYKPVDEDEGIAGLPVLGFDEDGDSDAASVLFLRNVALRLRQMGRLHSDVAPSENDHCQVSCVDWYGNARPIFLGERVFALLGYELVEGRIAGARIVERRRVDVATRIRGR